jgi:hypothetical protein
MPNEIQDWLIAESREIQVFVVRIVQERDHGQHADRIANKSLWPVLIAFGKERPSSNLQLF